MEYIERPYAGWFWATICSLFTVLGLCYILRSAILSGMDWIDWLALPGQLGAHLYIIRLIWRP